MAWDGDGKNESGNQSDSYKGNKCKIDPTAGAKDNEYKNCNLDIPFGFQDIDPMLITVIGEVVGNILSGNMPTNVANAFGNWLQLIAQVIVMFNAQQQYSQGGPGRYYSPDYKNISNPFTIDPQTSDGDEQISRKKRSSKKKRKNHKSDDVDGVIKQLNEEIALLKKEIDELKNKM